METPSLCFSKQGKRVLMKLVGIMFKIKRSGLHRMLSCGNLCCKKDTVRRCKMQSVGVKTQSDKLTAEKSIKYKGC